MLRTRRMLRVASIFFVAVRALGATTGCQQGEGERCQTNSDCEDGLTCNRSTNTCLSGSTQSGIDAGIDAPLDAAIDAGLDAAIDAMLDASFDGV